jgi:hypothetical protein
VIEADHLEVEPGEESFGHCDCCGRTSHSIWGFIRQVGGPGVAAYWVHWTEGHIEELGADFDLVVGTWGEGTSSADRAAVSLLYREQEDGSPSIMVVDAEEKPSLADKALKRGEIIGTPLAPQIFALIDAVFLQEKRLTGSSPNSSPRT